jgi:hypothetical protein
MWDVEYYEYISASLRWLMGLAAAEDNWTGCEWYVYEVID